MSAGAATPTLLTEHDVLLLDLDGVVYRGRDAVPYAIDALRTAVTQGVRCAYVTNNAARPPSRVAEHLRQLGLDVSDADVVTSAQAGARVVADRVPPGSPVLAVGASGVVAALESYGLTPVRTGDAAEVEGSVVAVMMGYGPDVSWRDLAAAAYAVGRGAAFVATNTDTSIPTARGIAPGNGTLVAAVTAASGVAPVVAGKPFAPLMVESITRTGARCPLVVGDRLDTDIAGAAAVGADSLLVLTGVSTRADVHAMPEHLRPTWIAEDLRALTAPLSAVERAGRVDVTGPTRRDRRDGTDATGPT